MPPIYWLTGSQPFGPSTTSRLVGRSSFHGSVKRAKYHDESTKVSIVSVSRRAALPHFGHGAFFQVGWWSSGLPGLSKDTSAGSSTGSWSCGHRYRAANCSQWITGIGQPQ